MCGAERVDSEFKALVEEIHKDAMLLNTEEYFVRVLEEKQDGMNRKLSRRQVQINQKLDVSKVHKLIIERVTAATGL